MTQAQIEREVTSDEFEPRPRSVLPRAAGEEPGAGPLPEIPGTEGEPPPRSKWWEFFRLPHA